MGVFNIAQYDSFLFFAHVLNESLAAGEDPTVHNNLAKRMWNATFAGECNRLYVNLRHIMNSLQIKAALLPFQAYILYSAEHKCVPRCL